MPLRHRCNGFSPARNRVQPDRSKVGGKEAAMTAAWRLVPTDPFRARTRNPALALAILAHLALLGALAVSALLRVAPPPVVDIFPAPVLRITLPPPPLEPVMPVPPQVAGPPFNVQVPRALA